jgi:hypothetical protein
LALSAKVYFLDRVLPHNLARYAVRIYSMFFAQIEFTHCRGEKIATGSQHPRGIMKGHIQSFRLGDSPSHIVSLRASVTYGDESARLYSVRLVGIGPNVIRLAGLERCGDAWVHQEWLCTLEKR